MTVEFYLGFWHLISKTLVDALNYSHQHGELSSSQKQTLITQLEKKEKDRRFLKNWRPISLVNLDVKIASKAIARRLEAVMPLLIPANQNGFIKGRSILDAVLTIDDVLEIGKIMSQSGILLAIDFEKAFDSLNHEFLYQVLQKMGFGPNFPQCIRTFYRNLSGRVLNNGFTTDIFFVKRGVRQGDPLSPLLFILALETLVCQIRENKNIKGFLINGKEIKTTLFADDMTCSLRDTNSHFQLLTSLQNFARYSPSCK